jgi:hypothetical protein
MLSGPSQLTVEHSFVDARQTMAVARGERLFAYVYLPAGERALLGEIMLQWKDDTWEHRAFWGTDDIPLGVTGTVSRRRVGDLPPGGVWTRLEVPASDVGLEGRTLNGMALTLNGRVGFTCYWSRAGKLRATRNWEEVGHANDVVAMAAINGKLFAATRDNRLWWRDPVGANVNWEEIGHANDVVAMAAINGKLFAATRDNRLWWRDPVGANVNWKEIGHANDVVAMAAINGKLFAATRDNRLWWRDPVGANVNWEEIGQANDVVAMAAINGKLFAATRDNRLWWRDPVE